MTGGKKKRRDINEGGKRFEEFSNQAVDLLDPFASQGAPAVNQLQAFSGLGSPEETDAANNAFLNSLFYRGGENAFNTEKDAIDAALANSGLLFSSARLNAVEDARNRNFQNAFAGFLNNTSGLANTGFNAAANQANVRIGQAGNAFNKGLAIADTRNGALGTIGKIASIGRDIGGTIGGF